MANEYNGNLLVLRDTNGNQMSLARFFQLALNDGDGHAAFPTQGKSSSFDPNHHAWDMGTGSLVGVVPARTPVGGTVVSASDGWNGGMGTHVIIEEDNGRQHRFMHMAEGSLQVSIGSSVTQGDQLGFIGNTGHSTGAHLHYDVMVAGTLIDDPIDAYDSATLPSGWNMIDAAAAGNWDYIQLDDGATDFGPPGGEVPSEPFFTDKRVYDISMYQTSAKSVELASDSTTGGFIIKWGQANSTSNYWQDDNFTTHLANARAGNIPVGCYFYWEINPDGLSDNDITTLFNAVFQYLMDAGVTPENTSLGLWLDFEGSHSATRANNDHVVELFNQVGTDLGFPVVGFYTYKSFLDANFTVASVKDYPFWYSRPGASRATVDSELSSYGFSAAYLWQDGYPDGGGWSPDISYTHKELDNDTVLQPIPTSGGGGGGGGGGGESYTLEVQVDVIPPKRIYFTPNPGLFNIDADLSNREQAIEILTDATDAHIYYTIDGSSPYEYVEGSDNQVTYSLSTSAIPYSDPITIYSDTHIRAIAIAQPTAFGQPIEILAKGSGTFLYAYRVLAPNWDVERESYAIEDAQSHENLFEENKQAFILEHTEETIEDIVYTTVHLSAKTGGESEASEEIPEIEPADSSDTQSPEPTPEPEPDTP